MKITIIGAGAMGCLFGGLLQEAGQAAVHLVDLRTEQVQQIKAHGLVLVHEGQERRISLQISLTTEDIGPADLVLLFVKHGQTRTAARSAAQVLAGDGLVLTLQNGMGNAELVAKEVGAERVLCGTTAQGAMPLGLGRIQHSGTGPTFLGPWQPGRHPGRLQELAELFSAAQLPTQAVDNIEPVLWHKLLINVGINAITALTGLRNGQLLDLKLTRDLVAAAVTEAASLAQALAVPVAEDIVDQVLAVAQATASNRSSMGQDIDARRSTEIEAINGYIVQRAEHLGLAVPVNRTLSTLIQTMQAQFLCTHA
jgi:2-dehydropantoate 2-reductase